MFVMTTNTKMKTSNSISESIKSLINRPQPRWLVALTGGVALAVLAKIALVASQIYAMLNATYDTLVT